MGRRPLNASLAMGVHSRSASHRRLSEVTPSFQGPSSSRVGCLAEPALLAGLSLWLTLPTPQECPVRSSDRGSRGSRAHLGQLCHPQRWEGAPQDWRSRAPRGWWVRSPSALPQKVAELNSERRERRLEIEAGAALTLALANREHLMRLGLAVLYKADP